MTCDSVLKVCGVHTVNQVLDQQLTRPEEEPREEEEVQVVLVLCQGYVPEKRCTNRNRTNQTQNSHIEQYISWGLGD
jgi:hypothetical protein